MTTATIDDQGETFDPGIHASVDNDGATPRYTRDGKLMRKRGPRRGGAPGDGAVAAPAPRVKIESARGRKSATDYRPALGGYAQLGASVLMMVSPLDAGTVAHHAPGVIDAIQLTAEAEPKVAAALDRILSMGPYAVLVTALTPMLVEVGANHGWIPEGLAGGLGARSLEHRLAAVGLVQTPAGVVPMQREGS